MLESFFSKVTCFKAWNFIKKRLQHSCFSVKFEKFLRTLLKNICESLLLPIIPLTCQSQRKIRQIDWISGQENDATLVFR